MVKKIKDLTGQEISRICVDHHYKGNGCKGCPLKIDLGLDYDICGARILNRFNDEVTTNDDLH